MANKDIFCAVPWHNSHLYWDGTYGACCSEKSKPCGDEKNLSDTTLEEWHNSEPMRNFRLRILGNERLPECKGCYSEENHGHESRRIRENFKVAIFTKQAFEKSFKQSPWYKKFEESATTGRVDKLPIDLHIDFGNECNLACKMCFPAASSRIAQQYTKWNILIDKKPNWTSSDLLYQKFLKNIKSIPNLHRIHIMGGEPLINKRFHDFVDWLVANQYNNLSLSFVSNGTHIDKKLIEKLKFFKSVDIEISLESIHDNNHYIRQGSETKKVLDNLNYLLEHRSSTFNIVLRSVPQLLNVNNYYEYILFAYKNNLSIQSIPLTNPEYLAIKVLPITLRHELIVKYQQVKEIILEKSSKIETISIGRDTSRLEYQLSQECNTIIELLKQPEPVEVDKLREELIVWLTRWDKLFKLNAIKFYPEYQYFLQAYGYCI
jgi:sulfatase maturation enzyme AslB (radical SAM superfamily)